MMKKPTPAARIKPVPLYQLRVDLDGAEPAVWRRLLVRRDVNLSLLHAALQVAMGWSNSHLHQFVIERKRYSTSYVGQHVYADQEPDLEEAEFMLCNVVKREQAQFVYEYDFGDCWLHLLTVEKIIRSGGPVCNVALCIDGENACPPDDCGGIGGYAELLRIIRNPKHEEYTTMRTWLGGPFDPLAFDLAHTNKWLQKLKRPIMSDEQLAKVLITRDREKLRHSP
jgi:hypothetical protein